MKTRYGIFIGAALFLPVIVILVTMVAAVSAAPSPLPNLQTTPDPVWIGPTFTCVKNDPGGHYDNWYCPTDQGRAQAEEDVIGVITTMDKTGPRRDVDLRHITPGGDWDDAARVGDSGNVPIHCFSAYGENACDAVGYTGSKSEANNGIYTLWSEGAEVRPGGWYQWGTTDTSSVWTVTVQFIYGTGECEAPTGSELLTLGEYTASGNDETGQSHALMIGQQYVIRTSNGPWNDGAADRYDLAVSFDGGTTWTPISQVSGVSEECKADYSPYSGYTFTAETDTVDVRVNDTAGAFADNTGSIDYTLGIDLTSPAASTDCAAYWTLGEKVCDATVDAGDVDYLPGTCYGNGGELSGAVGGGRPYAYKISGLPGAFDNGTETLETEVKAAGVEYQDDNVFLSNECLEENDPGWRVYYGITRSYWEDYYNNWSGVFPASRIDDQDGDYGNNSGGVEVAWYETVYTPPASDCGTRYETGAFIETFMVSAGTEKGLEVPITYGGLTPGQVYYLENPGPLTYYTVNGEKAWDFQIAPVTDGVRGTWQEIDTFADCKTDLDHERSGWYFTADSAKYAIRTGNPDALFTDYAGTLSLNLYGVIDNTIPAVETCTDHFDIGSAIYTGSVDATSTAGKNISSLIFEEDQKYLIQIDSPAYTDPEGTGKTADIRRVNTETGAIEYTDFSTWEGAICYDQDIDNYPGVYFIADGKSSYEVRASGLPNHDDNSGSLSFTVYEVDRETAPVLGCENNYMDVEIWTTILDTEDIAANKPSGEGTVNELSSDRRYQFVTAGGPWYNVQSGSGALIEGGYDLEISTDGGSNWQLLEDWLDCVVDVGDHVRGYKSNPTDPGPYYVRVYDPTGEYINNVYESDPLNLTIKVNGTARNDPGYVEDPESPGGWGEGCYSTCLRPSSWLEVGRWIDHARCLTVKWLSWCPYHSEMLTAIKKDFYYVEPWGTLLEIMDTAVAVKAELDSYTWVDEGGGGVPVVQSPVGFVFAPGEGGGAGIPLVGAETVWGEGDIDLTPETPSYSTSCNNLLADSLGARLAPSICFSFNVVNRLGLKTWFQWIWDMALLTGLFFYFKTAWTDRLQ